jgi:uncharacterized MAPEG superfamily protein
MQIEFISLLSMTIFFLFAWFPVSVGKINTFGKKWAASNRDPLPGKELSGWAARCERAHNNLKDNFPGFIVAILLLGLTEQFDRGTEIASVVYVISRLAHYFSYGIGHVLGRALFYFIGLGSNIYLLLKCIP